MRKCKKILSLLLALAMLAMLFAGCSGNNDPEETPGNSTPSAQTPSSDPTGSDPAVTYFEGRQSVLLLGQSNMAGRGDLADVEAICDDRILMLNESNEWVKMEEPIHFDKSAAGVGLAASFAKGFVETFGCELGLIPGAFGGTSISDWKVGGEYYNRALEMAKAAQKDSEICAILWHQGESNVSNPSGYGEKLQAILDAFISDLGLDADKLVIITGELREDSIDLSGRAEIHSELAKLADVYKNYGVASAEGLTLKSDNTHFDSASQRVFGYRYFSIFKTLVTGEGYEFDDDPNSYFIGEKKEPDETTGSSGTETAGTGIEGTIVEDTYVAAFNSNSKDKNYADYETIATNKNSARPLFKFNLSNILNSGEFEQYKATAKIQFTFAIIEGGVNLVSDTKCNAYGFLPGAGVGDADFSELTWNTCSSEGSHNELYRGGATYLYKDALLDSVDIEKTDKYITYTFSYSDIAQFVCTEAGDTYGYLVMGFDFSDASGVKFASMENSSYDDPAVSFVYDK